MCCSSKKLFLLLLFFCGQAYASAREPIIVIDPAGHARDLGRLLVDGYERAETLKFARVFQKSLLKKYNIRPIISRVAGEEVMPLQIPSFVNRLHADFFIRIHMYREESEKPKLFLYHLLFNPLVDFAKRTIDRFSLMPLYQAHFGNAQTSRFWGNKLYEFLSKDSYEKYFDCYSLRGMPLKSLVGIMAPAILLEIGICRENKWKSLVEPIAEGLSFLGDELKSEGV